MPSSMVSPNNFGRLPASKKKKWFDCNDPCYQFQWSFPVLIVRSPTLWRSLTRENEKSSTGKSFLFLITVLPAMSLFFFNLEQYLELSGWRRSRRRRNSWGKGRNGRLLNVWPSWVPLQSQPTCWQRRRMKTSFLSETLLSLYNNCSIYSTSSGYCLCLYKPEKEIFLYFCKPVCDRFCCFSAEKCTLLLK